MKLGIAFRWPITNLGYWAVALASGFVTLFVINLSVFMPSDVEFPWRNVLLPIYAITMLVCGLSSGIVGLIAILLRQEQSVLVWLTLLLGMLILSFLLGEFLVSH